MKQKKWFVYQIILSFYVCIILAVGSVFADDDIDRCEDADNPGKGRGCIMTLNDNQIPASIDDLAKTYKKVMNELMAHYQVAGAAMTIIHEYNGEDGPEVGPYSNSDIQWNGGMGFGLMDVDSSDDDDESDNTPTYNETIFRIASGSKPLAVWGLYHLKDFLKYQCSLGNLNNSHTCDYYDSWTLKLDEPIDPVIEGTCFLGRACVDKNDDAEWKGYLTNWSLDEIPNLTDNVPYRVERINLVTLRRLINHRSGIVQSVTTTGSFGLIQDVEKLIDEDDSDNYEGMPTTIDVLNGYVRLKLPRGMAFGAVFTTTVPCELVNLPNACDPYADTYSSVNYTLIQLVIEEILEQEGLEGYDYGKYMEALLTDEEHDWGLNMQNSTFLFKNNMYDNLSQGFQYLNWEKTEKGYEPTGDYAIHENAPYVLYAAKAAAGLYTTAQDYGKFAVKFIDYQRTQENDLVPTVGTPFSIYLDKQYMGVDGDGKVVFIGNQYVFEDWYENKGGKAVYDTIEQWKSIENGFNFHSGSGYYGNRSIVMVHPDSNSGIVLLDNTGVLPLEIAGQEANLGGYLICFDVADLWRAYIIDTFGSDYTEEGGPELPAS